MVSTDMFHLQRSTSLTIPFHQKFTARGSAGRRRGARRRERSAATQVEAGKMNFPRCVPATCGDKISEWDSESPEGSDSGPAGAAAAVMPARVV